MVTLKEDIIERLEAALFGASYLDNHPHLKYILLKLGYCTENYRLTPVRIEYQKDFNAYDAYKTTGRYANYYENFRFQIRCHNYETSEETIFEYY